MTRHEFQRDINDFDGLIFFTSSHRLDTMANVYTDEERTNAIESWVGDAYRNMYANELRDELNNIDFDTYSDYWVQIDNNPTDWKPLDIYDFENYKQSALADAEECGVFNDDDDDRKSSDVVKDIEEDIVEYQDDAAVSVFAMMSALNK